MFGNVTATSLDSRTFHAFEIFCEGLAVLDQSERTAKWKREPGGIGLSDSANATHRKGLGMP